MTEEMLSSPAPSGQTKQRKKGGAGYKVGMAFTYIILILFALIVLVPFYLILISSVKSNSEILSPTFTWWPEIFTLEGYSEVLSSGGEVKLLLECNILGAFFNTLWQSLIPTVVGVFVSGLSGYAIAKLKFPCRGAIFSFLIATMMIPSTITMVSSYMLYDTIGWTNGPLPLIIPGLFGTASNVFFMRQYFEGIPDELLDAAKIDGLNNFTTYIMIALPVSVPVFISLSLLTFISHYNAYLSPLLYLGDNSRFYTLQIMLKSLMSLYKNDWNIILSACIVSILPLLLLYLFTQNFFIRGISISSGLKG